MTHRIPLWLKRFAIATAGFFLSLSLLAFLFEDRIGRLALQLVRQELTTDLSVSDFQLSFIRAFPLVRSTLKDITLLDTNGDTLLTCARLGVHLPWSAIWSSTTAIEAISLEDGAITLKKDKKGTPNYLVIKPSPPDAPPKRLILDIRKASLNRISIQWDDRSNRQLVSIRSRHATFKAKVREDHILIDHDFDASLISLQTGKDAPAFSHIPVRSNGQFRLEWEENRYTFEDTRFTLDGLAFQLDGTLLSGKTGTTVDVEARTELLPVTDMWKSLHRILPQTTARISPHGQASIHLKAKGTFKNRLWPEVNARLSWMEGSLSLPSGPDLENIHLVVDWLQPDGKSTEKSRVTIREGKASLSGHPLNLTGTWSNFQAPFLDIHLDGALPAALVQTSDLAGESGIIHLEDIHLKGHLSRTGLTATGKVLPSDVTLRLKDDPLHIRSGTLILKDEVLELDATRIGIARSDLVINASIYGFPHLFRIHSGVSPIRFEGDIRGESLDVQALMTQFDTWRQKPTGQKDTPGSANTASLGIGPVNGKLQASFGRFSYGEINGKSFRGTIHLLDDKMLVEGDADAMGGHFNLEGELNWRQNVYAEGSLWCEHVDVKEAFRQCRNFGQQFLTMEHLAGGLSSQILFESSWDGRGRIDPDKLHVYAAIQIDNGELEGLKVLESFSDFVHVRDLRHVRFSSLQNYLEVDRGKVYLPRMLIQSNAMALDITGLHGFDQSIDYGIRVDAGQVLINRMTRHDPSLSPKEDKRKGMFNLYYHINGHVDDYTIKPARHRVRDDFERSIQHRARIRQALVDEFGTVLFTDPSGEEELAELTPIPSFPTNNGIQTGEKSPPKTGNRPPPAPKKEESEYLEDFEIIGGGGKRKQ